MALYSRRYGFWLSAPVAEKFRLAGMDLDLSLSGPEVAPEPLDSWFDDILARIAALLGSAPAGSAVSKTVPARLDTSGARSP